MSRAIRWRDPAQLRRALALYVLVDDLGVAEGALRGGATAVQLRAKGRPTRALCELARRLAPLCAAAGALLIVNDRLDVAMACGAHGVHLGQDDLAAADARAIGGPDLVVGVSAATPEEAGAAWRDGADYLGTGAVYGTSSKADAGSPIGPGGVAEVARATPLPIVAIGGIQASNARAALAAGAAGIAVISAVAGAPDAALAAAQLAAIVRRSLVRGGDPAP